MATWKVGFNHISSRCGSQSNLHIGYIFFTIRMFGACFYCMCTSPKSNCKSVLCIYQLIILPYLCDISAVFFPNDVQSVSNMEMEKGK